MELVRRRAREEGDGDGVGVSMALCESFTRRVLDERFSALACILADRRVIGMTKLQVGGVNGVA